MSEKILNKINSMGEETKNYVDGQVRLATDSAVKALTNLLGDYNHKLEKHREEEAEFKEKLIETVKKEIKETVNGKIDNIKKTQEQDRETSELFRAEMREFMKGITPIKSDFDKRANALSYLKEKRNLIVSISITIGALLVIQQYIVDIITKTP